MSRPSNLLITMRSSATGRKPSHYWRKDIGSTPRLCSGFRTILRLIFFAPTNATVPSSSEWDSLPHIETVGPLVTSVRASLHRRDEARQFGQLPISSMEGGQENGGHAACGSRERTRSG